jgi:2-polyprenyl-6-methoxyphenol hydroxylase-like FAD-dependent oxidoreductase
MSTEVLIVGAGPAGLGLACGLLQHGIEVRVIDKASGPATTSRANFLHARGSEVLDRLGALDDLPDRCVRAMKITTYLGDKPLMRIHFGDPGMRTSAPPMVISQAAVEGALRDRLHALGGEINWATPLVAVRREDAAVVATVGTEEVRASWLVGCDGAGSAVRRLSGIGFPGVKLSERFLLADVRLDWDLDRSGTTGWINPDGLIGVMPMPNDMWRVIAYDPGQHSEKLRDTDILNRLNDILPKRSGREVRILDAEWLSMFSVHRRLAETYRHGRILIAGDAGHTHAPFGGQGMLTGLGDVENVAWKLALVVTGRADEKLLDTYEAERRPLAADVLRNTSAVTKLNIASSPVGRFLRDRIVARIFNLAVVQRWATYQTSQLWVSYRRGPLAQRSLAARKPRQGDRVADLPCVGSNGEPTRLHAELRGRWALLSADPRTTFADTMRHHLGDRFVVLRPLNDRPEALLVRPDGHLGWRGRRAATLDAWFRQALGAGRVR